MVGGGDAVGASGSGSGGARLFLPGADPAPEAVLAAASEAEVRMRRTRARSCAVSAFPARPWTTEAGAMEDAPGFKTGDVALPRLLTMRLDPELAGAHPLAAEARGAARN